MAVPYLTQLQPWEEVSVSIAVLKLLLRFNSSRLVIITYISYHSLTTLTIFSALLRSAIVSSFLLLCSAHPISIAAVFQ